MKAFTIWPFTKYHLLSHLTVLFLLIGSLAQAQEAFYIFRNDSDFNGFFYDEVVEMRYSKFDFDSVEHENYIMYEVELTDTLYRIPLAAIDSIIFQQPEIKLNPNVKFMGKDGYCPYVYKYRNYGSGGDEVVFKDLPSNMMPQVGDVFIGLSSDACAEAFYDTISSFSCVVNSVYTTNEYTQIFGRPVSQIDQVFEQYITIEELMVDQQGNIHRRIAGCTPDGMPRPIIQKEGNGEATIIDFDGTISHSWDVVGDSVQVDLSADMNLKLRVRAYYNISWRRFYVKLTPDILAAFKPSVGLSVKREYKVKLSDIVPLPEGIPFPAVAPVFELCPLPTLFLNMGGKLEARLNLPKFSFGVGADFVIDSWSPIFPIYGLIHLADDDEPEGDEENMMDLSAEVKLSGSLYAGIEFQLAVNTNRWFKKVLQAGIGMHFTAGPKIEAEISYNTNVTSDENAYYLLSNGAFNYTGLSLGFNAGAKASIGWSDEKEVTFLEANKDLFQTTYRLAPTFTRTSVEIAGNYAVLTLHPEPCYSLLYKDYKIGVRETLKDKKLIATCGGWHQTVLTEDDEFSYMMDIDTLPPNIYSVFPIVEGQGESYEVKSASGTLIVPLKARLESNDLHFFASGGEQSIIFYTNCDKFSFRSGGAANQIQSVRIDTLDKKQGKYKLVVTAKPHTKLFGCDFDTTSLNCPELYFYHNYNSTYNETRKISFSQDLNDLSGAYIQWFRAEFAGEEKIYEVSLGIVPQWTRVGKDSIVVEGHNTDVDLSMTIRNNTTEASYVNGFINYFVTGSATRHINSSRTNTRESTTILFVDQPGQNNRVNGQLSGGEYNKYVDGELVQHDSMREDAGLKSLEMTITVPATTTTTTP